MNFIARIWIFLVPIFQATVNCSVNVTVLYESLCPDSMRFISKQLYPTYNQLKQHMNVELVPFGKAHYATNPWRIACQHGPQECWGNAIQACALARYTDTDMKVNFVNCVMSSRYPPEAGSRCAKALNYDYQGIEECAAGEEGQKLISQAGDRTLMFKDVMTFIPTIILNEEFNGEVQRAALRNLKSVVCNNLGQPLPDECQ